MGIKKVDREATINFVSLHDDAIDAKAMGEVDIAKYRLTRDYSILKFVKDKEPTIFILKPNLSVRGSARVQNNSFDVNQTKNKSNVKVLFGNIAVDSLKEIIVGIENPKYFKKGEGIEFKQSGDGLILDSCLEEIPNLIRVEISTFYLALQKQHGQSGDVKKN